MSRCAATWGIEFACGACEPYNGSTLRMLKTCCTKCFSCLALAVLLTFPARAELIFDVFVGYGLGASDGVVAESAWFPVTCEIQNDGPGFNATVEIVGGQFGNGQARVVPLELPTGTRKRFTVPVYCAGRYRTAVDARLRNEKGKVVAEHLGLEPRQHVDWQSPLIASIPRSHGGAAALPEGVGRNSQLLPAATRLSTEGFPENPIALEGIETLYLHSARALELKVPQVNALLAWLHGGGHLVLGIEQPSDVHALPWLVGVLPCQLGGVTPTDTHGGLHSWLTQTAHDWAGAGLLRTPARPANNRSLTVNPFLQLSPDDAFANTPMPVVQATVRDGTVVIGSAETPLVITAPRGRGQLSVLLFSPELEPFRSWQHRNWFWAKLAGVPMTWLASVNTANSGSQPFDGVFGAMVDSRQIRKLPVGWLLLLLVAYLVVIGPLDHYWLKKLNRQMLTWITFPTYVVLFSVLIYLIGYSLRSGETEWNELHIVDVVPHGERADLRGRTWGSAYSPVNAKYPVASEQPFATLRGEIAQGGAQEVSRAVIEQRGHSYAAQLSVPVWTSQLYLSDWWRPGPAPVTLSVTAQGERWVAQIENRSGQRIPQAKLIIDGRVYEVGNIPETKRMTVQRDSGQPLSQFVQQYAASLQSVVMARQQQFGRQYAGHVTDIFNNTAAVSFLGATNPEANQNQQPFGYYGRFVAPRGFDLTPLLRREHAILIAFAPGESIVPALNKFSPRHSRTDTVYRIDARIQRAN